MTSIVLALGDEGRPTDAAPHTVAGELRAAGFDVHVVPCVGGPLDGRDGRLTRVLREHVDTLAGERLVVGGFSRGARVAAAAATSLGAVGVLAFGFPFHARTNPDASERIAALHEVTVPMLLFQGTRDSLGNRQQVLGYRLPLNIDVRWLEDANHGLQPRARSGFTRTAQLIAACQVAVGVLGGWSHAST